MILHPFPDFSKSKACNETVNRSELFQLASWQGMVLCHSVKLCILWYASASWKQQTY